VISSDDRDRVIKLLTLAVDQSEAVDGSEAQAALAAVRRILSSRGASLADALMDQEALALLREAQARPGAGSAVFDPLRDFEG
jgi:hypothetical protein